jgi:predicted transcriptional regulator
VEGSGVLLDGGNGTLLRAGTFGYASTVGPVEPAAGSNTGWGGQPAESTPAGLSGPIVAGLAGTSLLALVVVALAKLGVLPFYTRLSDDEVLDNDTRREVYHAIGDEPGLSLSEVAEATGHVRSTVCYHLRQLDDRGMVRSVKGPDARRFFHVDEGSVEELERRAVLATGRASEVYEAIETNPSASLSEVCEATGMAPSSAHRIVDRLVEAEIVAKRQDGRAVELTPRPA